MTLHDTIIVNSLKEPLTLSENILIASIHQIIFATGGNTKVSSIVLDVVILVV